MYSSNSYNNKYLPSDRSNLDYYDIKYFLPLKNSGNINVEKSTPLFPYNNNLNLVNSIWNEGKPNNNNINYTNHMKKERKGHILSMISALRNNEVNVSLMEKQKMLDALMKALETLTEKPVMKIEKENNIPSKPIRNTKVDTIEEIYFGGKKKMFLDHPCLSSSVDLKNNMAENNQVSGKLLNLIDYYISQNKKEQHLQFNPDNHSFKGNKDCKEFVENYEKIRFNSLSHDHPDYKEEEKKTTSPIKDQDYTVLKFNNEKFNYDKLKLNYPSRSAQSVDPNRTIIRIFNAKDSQEDSFKKIRIINNLNKNSNLDVISKYNLPTKQDKNYFDEVNSSKNDDQLKDFFGKPAKIRVDPSKEIKGNLKLINDLKDNKNRHEKESINDKPALMEMNNQENKVENKSKVDEYLKLKKLNNINLSRRAKVK